MENENLSKKNYAKYDRTYMMFGSIMNGLQGYIAQRNNQQEVKDMMTIAWNSAKQLTSEFVDELYEQEKPQKQENYPLKENPQVKQEEPEIPIINQE